MRISDWSSDVCSSDLEQRLRHGPGAPGAVPCRSRDGGALAAEWVQTTTVRSGPWERVGKGSRCGDRKSGVEGKSVSVRVDLGGRRIMQKKTMRYNTCELILNNKKQVSLKYSQN